MLEILLVTVLLFTLSYAVYLSVRETVRTQGVVETRTALLQEFRSAFGIMERDLRSTYFSTAEDFGWNPRPVDPERPEKISATPAKPSPVTIFQGKETSIFFSTRTHQRLAANAPENEEHFVYYELRNSELTRSESRRAIRLEDRENPQDFRSFVLINKVSSLKFSYWSQRQAKWIPDWDSEKSENLNKIPEAVRIELKFTPEINVDSKKASKEMTLITAVRLPEAGYRNIEWTTPPAATTTGPPQ